MPDTTAKIRAKGLDATGVTEELANQLFTQRGSHHMAIIEYKVEETHQKSDGTRKVDLVLTQVEPATSEDLEDHLRELSRTCYYNRGTGDQPHLPAGSDEPTVEGVLAAGAKHRPHPFLPVDATQDQPICDVCGLLEAAGVHSTQDTLEEDDDPAYDQDAAEEDSYAGPHDFEAGPDDSCICGLAYGDPIHGHLEVDQADEEPWEYPGPEGQGADTKPASTIPDPFATTT